jgi:rhomboid protease GluP
MAFGITPKYTQDLSLENLSFEQSLVIAAETIKKFNWQIGLVSNNGLIAYTNKGIFSRNAEIKILISGRVAKITSTSTGTEMVDWGNNKKNTDEFIRVFNKTKTTISSDDISLKFNDLKILFVSDKQDPLIQLPQSSKNKISSFFSIFIPSPGYYITPIILNINILIFIIMAVSGVNILLPDSESLLKWGANFRPSTLDGQWWRLFTNCFLHIGIFHLLMNMYALLYIGLLLEPHLGKTRFIAAYFLTCLTASTTSMLWHPLTISAGASGAIFGLYGVFLAMLTTNLIEKTARKALLTSIVIFVGYNLLNGLKGGIDNAAHLGGLLGGLIIGYAFIPSLKDSEESEIQYKAILYLSVLVIAFSTISYKNIPNDFGKYDKLIQEFAPTEARAMEVYKLAPNTPKEKMLYEIKNRGIYYWNENITMLKEIEKLKLPSQLIEKNQKLLLYCQLRIKSLELSYKAIDENSPMYQTQINDYNTQIENIVNDLTKKK